MSSSDTIIWVASVISLSLFLTLCYAASASAAWPRARPRIPLWFFLLFVFFPPFFPFLLLFLFLRPPAYVAEEDYAISIRERRAPRVVIVRPAETFRMSRI